MGGLLRLFVCLLGGALHCTVGARPWEIGADDVEINGVVGSTGGVQGFWVTVSGQSSTGVVDGATLLVLLLGISGIDWRKRRCSNSLTWSRRRLSSWRQWRYVVRYKSRSF